MSQFSLKSVIIGDGAVGKTSLLLTYENGGVYRQDYIPPSADFVEYTSEDVRMGFWDTAGGEDYDRLRPLVYPNTDVFLLCFALGYYTSSYYNIKERWCPEVTFHCPNTPIILVGTKLDLCDNPQNVDRDGNYCDPPITTAEGMELSDDIGAVKYIECSSLQNKGVNDVIDAAVSIGMKYKVNL